MEEEELSRWDSVKRYVHAVRTADMETIVSPVERAVAAAEEKIATENPDLPRSVARDAAVIAGVTAVMMSMKMIKTLPGLPFAPGHKNAVLMPLYVLGGEMTSSRLGSTACGLTMGIVSLMFGDGRYGVFELLKHLAPGLLVDALHPIVRRTGGSVGVYVAFGVVLSAGRFAADVGVAVLLGAPKAFYAYIGSAGVTHLIAGGLSGFISAPLVAAVRAAQGASQHDMGTAAAPAEGGSQQRPDSE